MKNNTLDKKEIEKFLKMAEEWWNPTGKFKPLHKFNPIRIKYIKNNLINDFSLKNKKKPLDGLKILDIGCGGGLLSEPLARLGAKVTGIDPIKRNIEIAKHHLKKSKLNIKYYNFPPEKFITNNKYDVIVIGGGHAGCEAVHAAYRKKLKTCLISISKKSIGQMSCNPAIGGLGKTHLVKEID